MDDSLRGYYRNFCARLAQVYDAEESTAIASLVFEDKLLIKAHHIHILDNKVLTGAEIGIMEDVLSRLLKHEPVQYILGTAYFCGFRFKVNPHVLIPRRETEEITDIIVKENRDGRTGIRILDIGTGSGCIAISLSKKIPGSQVVALDISPEAISVAKENALLNKAAVDFIIQDILGPGTGKNEQASFDIIVSNPPYITQPEKTDMRDNVLLYEPHSALFVTDNDPLQFYKAIAAYAALHLEAGGKLYLEVNEGYANEVKELLEQHAFTHAHIVNDMQGKPRLVKALR